MRAVAGRFIFQRAFVFALIMVVLTAAPTAQLARHSPNKTQSADSVSASAMTKIAFASDRDGNLEIYLMDGDGGSQTRLTEDPGEDFSPAWSPDGTRLAFVSNRDGNAEIYVMNADGTGQTRLTNNSASDLRPAWASDGAHIAFVTNRDGNDEIYLMNSDGSNPINLTKDAGDDASFSYSPDGTMIVFSSTRQDHQFQLYRMTAAGTGVVRLTQTVGDDIDPSWSGAQIMFQSNRDDNDEIYRMTADGQNQTRLTSNSDLDEDPSQAAGGARTVFASTRDGGFEIYGFNSDGTGLIRLTTNNATDFQPAAQPLAKIPLPPPAGTVTLQFSATDYAVNEGDAAATLTVNRSGSSAAAATVEFATVNGTAANRTDFTANFGTLRFSAGETSKTIRLILTDDAYTEGPETLTVTLGNPGGAVLGPLNTATVTITDNATPPTSVNPIDDARSFVNQHYSDFLNRPPDQAGSDFWTNKITSCGNNLACLIANRNAVSAAFFIETEFQDSGFYVTRLYKGVLGRQPTYQQFIVDRAHVVGGSSLAADKVALANDFVTREEFLARYPANQTNSQFVNLLFDTAGLVPFTAERNQLITDMNNGKTRAQAIMQVIEIPQFKTREFNPAFVLMQYLGYLRRDPDPAGYAFWLDVLTRDPTNRTGMVCSFITSSEYQLRFGPTVTASNAQCTIR